MADAFLSTGTGGLRPSRSHYVDMPRDSLFADSRWRSVDEERMRRLEAEADVRSCMERCSVFAAQCGNLFCVGKMPVLTRVLVLWFWVLVLTAVAALLTVTVALGPVTYSLSPRDSLLVSAKISNFFCGSVSLQGPAGGGLQKPYTAYLLDSMPTVNYRYPQRYDFQKVLYLGQKDKEYWKFYFLPGSNATANVCLGNDGSATAYSIKGRGNFRAWLSNPDCEGCYVSRTSVSACSGPTNSQPLHINASSEDDYFIAILSTGVYARINVDVSVNRTVYDTSLAMRNCDQTSQDCRFPLNFGYTQYVVFMAGVDWDQEGQLTSACHPRVWTFVDIFLLGTVVLGLTLSLLICRCARDPGMAEMQIVQGRRGWWSYRRLGRGSVASERSPLLGSASSIPSRAAGPPRYDDVISREEGSLPSGAPPPYSRSESGATGTYSRSESGATGTPTLPALPPPPAAATEQAQRDQHRNAEDDPHPAEGAGRGEGTEGKL